VTLVAFAVSHDDDDARRIENTHRMKFRFLPQRQGHSYAHGEAMTERAAPYSMPGTFAIGTSANSIEYFLALPAFGESLFTVEGLHTLVQAAGALAASGHPARG